MKYSGQVYLEYGRGGQIFGGDETYTLKLWEMPENPDGNEGYKYGINGERSSFWHTHKDSAIMVEFDLFPDDFKYSFYHGMSDLSTTSNKIDLEDLINNSDWQDRKVTKDEVDHNRRLNTIEINTIDDIRENIDTICHGYIPHRIIDSVLKIANIKKTNPDFGNYKGESGIAYYYDMMNYRGIIENIKGQHNECV